MSRLFLNRYITSLLLLVCLCCRAAADDVKLQSSELNVSNGLPSNSVQFMQQDSKGFMWFATAQGLVRYDGKTLTDYHRDIRTQGRLGLADEVVTRLHEDRHGYLWIRGHNFDYSCYDLQQGRFVPYLGTDSLGNYTNIEIFPDGDTWLFSTAGGGAIRVSYGKDRRLSAQIFSARKRNLPSDNVRFVSPDRRGRVWIGTDKGLTVYQNGKTRIIDRKNFIIGPVEHGDDIYMLSNHGRIFKAGADVLTPVAQLPLRGRKIITGNLYAAGKWYVFSDAGVNVYDFGTGKATVDPVLDIPYGRVLTDSRGDYWVYNDTGKVRFIDRKTGRMRQLTLIPDEVVRKIDSERYSVVRRDDGYIWISTYGNGLFLYDPRTDALQHVSAGKQKTDLLNSNYITHLAADNAGGVWLSMERAGLQRVNIHNSGVTRLVPDPAEDVSRANRIKLVLPRPDGSVLVGGGDRQLISYRDGKAESESMLPANAYSAVTDGKGTVWIATRGAGLVVGDRIYSHDDSDASSVAQNDIFALCRDRKRRIWIGTKDNGIDLAVPDGADGYVFRHFLSPVTAANSIRALSVGRDGRIWAATFGGLLVFDPDRLIKGEPPVRFSSDDGTFCANDLRSLCPQPDGDGMWVGTRSEGVSLCTLSPDGKTLNYRKYTSDNGLVNNVVQSIRTDRRGNLWIGTENGMSRLDVGNGIFETFFFAPDFTGNVYSENTAAIDAHGRLYFGTDRGVTVIDPALIADKTNAPPVTLTGLHINGSAVTPMSENSPLTRDLAYSDEIRLRHYQNSLEIDFSSLDFNDDGETQYTYWLENYDKGYSPATSQSHATYKYLEAGTYVFHVRTVSGSRQGEETTLRIVIAPPFWKSWPAILLYILLAAVALYFIWRTVVKFNRLHTQMAVEKQLTEHKLVFFTNISHEFRTPLTLIRGAMEKIDRIPGMPGDAREALRTMDKSTGRMMRLINQLITFRKIQKNKFILRLQETEVIAFLNDIFVSFNELAEQNDITYRFVHTVDTYTMFIDRDSLDKIVYNLISNAFKYTPTGGAIILEAGPAVTDGQFEIRVTDTGVGIPKEKQADLFSRFMQTAFSHDSMGVGLNLSHELVKILKGTIRYDDNPVGGAVFTVTLPTDKNVYRPDDFYTGPDEAVPTEEIRQENTVLPVDFTEKYKDLIGPLNSHKILVIEDDPDVRRFIMDELGKYFEVQGAPDGQAGLEKAREWDPDLIVCDVMMPVMNGLEVTRKLKHDLATSHIPVILLTALGSVESHTEGIDSGADAYVTKPFSLQLLLTRIIRLIEQRARLKEKYTNEPGMIHTAMYTTDRDKEFAERMNRVLEANMANSDFSIDDFAAQMNMSRTTFYKKIKGITGYSPVEYLKIIRMKKASELLLSPDGLTVSEVAYKVGFDDPFYFSKCFKQQFGLAPVHFQRGSRPKS